MKRIAPRSKGRLPPPEGGWFATQYAILIDGSLARLEANFDIRAAVKARWDSATANQPLGPWPPFPLETLERIARFDGSVITVTPAVPVEEVHARFDRLPNGNWIVVECRCGVVPANARRVSARGETIGRLLLGDGIETLQCDAEGFVWVGYFDEGIFGNNGWGRPNGPAPIGMTGLNRFDENGMIVWPDRDAQGGSGWPLPMITDCSVMNVTRDAVWICPYTDFPITRIGYDGSVRTWAQTKIGAHILAVDGDLVVLLGGYEGESHHGVLLKLGQDSAQRIGEFEIDIDVKFLQELPFACGRADTAHFVIHDTWYRLTVQDIVGQLT